LINAGAHQLNDIARGRFSKETSMKIRPTWLATGGCLAALAAALFLSRDGNKLILESSASGATYKGKTAQEWVAGLKNPDIRVRWKTLAAINYIEPQGEDQLPVLREILNDNDPAVRVQAVQAIGGLGEAASASVPDLIKALSDNDVEVRTQAACSINWMGPDRDQAIPALIAALDDREARVRHATAGTLGSMGPSAKEAVPALLKRVNATKKDEQLAMVQAVWYIDPDTARQERLPIIPTRRWAAAGPASR
jgi:HEAT repeat protein